MHDTHSQPIQTSQGPMFVRECGCGGIHLCLGGLSLNLARETAGFLYAQLEQILGETKDAPKSAEESEREMAISELEIGRPSTGGWVRRLFPE